MIKMQPLSDRELLVVLAAAKKENQRDHCLLLICYSHAMRANECGKLLVSDISIKDWTIRVARSKGSLLTVEKLAPHSNPLLDQRKTVESWLRVKPESPYLFPSRKNGVLSRVQVYRLFRDYAERAGLPHSKRGVHALKHTLGQKLADRGTDIKELRVIMGHKLITSTQHYFEVSQDQADASKQAALLSVRM
ncbi:MAG: tyrosine-type recombinase/integrase [Candidatus Acidiferrales bacterium]